jgi:hypothetical protein
MPLAKEIFLFAILSKRAKRLAVQLQVLQYSLSFHQCSILNHSLIHSPFSDAT